MRNLRAGRPAFPCSPGSQMTRVLGHALAAREVLFRFGRRSTGQPMGVRRRPVQRLAERARSLRLEVAASMAEHARRALRRLATDNPPQEATVFARTPTPVKDCMRGPAAALSSRPPSSRAPPVIPPGASVDRRAPRPSPAPSPPNGGALPGARLSRERAPAFLGRSAPFHHLAISPVRPISSFQGRVCFRGAAKPSWRKTLRLFLRERPSARARRRRLVWVGSPSVRGPLGDRGLPDPRRVRAEERRSPRRGSP